MTSKNNHMDYSIISQEALSLQGLSTKLTTSHNKNFDIIRSHWQFFNKELKLRELGQGTKWQKYGITMKRNNDYYYLTAISSNKKIKGFETLEVPSGSYASITHLGDMRSIKTTINKIYREIIPNSSLIFDENGDIIHFERYNSEFKWNNKDSKIGIFIRLK